MAGAVTLLLPVGGYLLGSILPARILGRRRGVDFLRLGKNPGAAETYRTFGLWPSVLVYLLDASKAVIPLVAGKVLDLASWSLVATAAAVVAGHNWSIFNRFWGGKGLASASGALLVLIPEQLAYALPFGLLAWWVTGWVPASGVVGFPIIIALTWSRIGDPVLRMAAIVVPLMVVLRVLSEVKDRLDDLWAL